MKFIGQHTSTSSGIINTSRTFVFTQNGASNTWVVEHNLNSFPSVTVVDSGDSIVKGMVVYNTKNKITLTFFAGGQASAFSGKAYLN